MKKFVLLCTTAAVAVVPSVAFGQSTGTTETENKNQIVITGTRSKSVGGVVAPAGVKTRAVLTQEFTAKQRAYTAHVTFVGPGCTTGLMRQ